MRLCSGISSRTLITQTQTNDEVRLARIAWIREDISTRLWHVNAGMSSERFNELMDGMALLQYNCERRVSGGFDDEDRRSGIVDRRGPA